MVRQLSAATTSNLKLMRTVPPALNTTLPNEMLHTAFAFYHKLLEQLDSLSEILRAHGISKRKLENELLLLGEIGYLKLIRHRNLEDGAEAIINRDHTLEAYLAFTRELLAITHLAHSSRPHLYRLGIKLAAQPEAKAAQGH